MNNESVKHRFLLRILVIQSNPDGITRNKVGLDAEIRGPPVFTGIFGDFERKVFYRIFRDFARFSPQMFYQCFTIRLKCFTKTVKTDIRLSKRTITKTIKYYVFNSNYI